MLTSICIIAAIIFVYFIQRKKQSNSSNKKELAKFLTEWVEILNKDYEPLFMGRIVAWLSPEEFGEGSTLLEGILILKNASPELSSAIQLNCNPIYFEESSILVRVVTNKPNSEELIIGPLADRKMQVSIEYSLNSHHGLIDVFTNVSSDSVGLMETKESRSEFTEVWNKFAKITTLAEKNSINQLIRPILLKDWKPIPGDVPDDEYDSYIPQLYRLIVTNNREELRQYLQFLETDYIGVGYSGDAHIRSVVDKLLALRNSF